MDVNETSNNDDIAARREARRRKILENSKSRLTRITGREHTDENDKKPNGMYSTLVYLLLNETVVIIF